ncbi:MAG: TonB-dependent receptor, partial [Deltaproteobacteria bacterium]|nr:TonB-dependent receptor [Deltaproteobacteria bacterium]
MQTKRQLLFFITIFSISIYFNPLACLGSDETIRASQLESITVKAQSVSPTSQTGKPLYSSNELTATGLKLSGTGGLSSVFQAFSILPGINPELNDPSGIGGTEIRLRGIKSMFSSMTVEDIPNYGIMGVGPRDYIYDLENMDSIKFYRGASPASVSSGIGNRGGSFAMEFTRPHEDFSLEFEQCLGSNSLTRTFFRLDSGILPGQSKFFVSGSHTQADKWKGAGEVGGRNHLTIGARQEVDDNCNIELFYNYNQSGQDLYKGLSYSQASSISHHYDDDYLEELTGTSADKNYYKYHHTETRNNDLVMLLHYQIKEHHSLSLKPYLSTEDKKWLDGGADKYVVAKRFGGRFEYTGEWDDLKLDLGYWHENHNLEKYIRKNRINHAGRNYAGWAYLAENRGSGNIHTPYLQLQQAFGPLTCQAGIKYFYYNEPPSRTYLSDKTTPYSYKKALNNNLGIDSEMSLKAMRYRKWLPSMSIAYTVSPEFEFYANYGRNFMRPYAYVPIAMTYSNNRKKFQATGITLQDIFDKWKLETSDNFDIGLNYQHRWFSFCPTIFYATHHDLLFATTSPEIDVNYHQNIGDATVFGGELELNIYPTDNLMVYFNPSYTKATVGKDKLKNKSHGIKGNDLPDTPRWLLKGGFIYNYKRFTISPSIKYVDTRYGDIDNREKVDSYTTIDLMAGYKFDNLWEFKEANLEIEFTNLFNQKYVASIKADDDGFVASQYYSGIPFTVVCKIN